MNGCATDSSSPSPPSECRKSTLMNQLARREGAIVSPHAGTPRDVIEVQLDLDGYPMTVIDTAGIRRLMIQSSRRVWPGEGARSRCRPGPGLAHSPRPRSSGKGRAGFAGAQQDRSGGGWSANGRGRREGLRYFGPPR